MSDTSNYKLTGGKLILLVIAIFLAVFLAGAALVVGQKPQAKGTKTFAPADPAQQPLYSEYKGVRIGMTEQEVHAKLGQGVKTAEADFYVVSETETAQIQYDQSRKVTAISIDYVGGVGAPDYRAVVGSDIQTRADGSLYKIVHYESLGFWVSYNKTSPNATVTTVSITIQKILK
jgi:hypothetical protein